jgi:hypothetical protein
MKRVDGQSSQVDVQSSEWQEETVEVPTLDFDPKTEKLVPGTRQETQRFKHVPLIPQNICAADDHYFELVDGGRRQNGQVLAKCRKCPIGVKVRVGSDKIENGRVVPLFAPN